MATIKILFIPLLAAFIFYSCAEVFEPNLASQHQILRNPKNNQIFTDSTLSFFWDSIPGAAIYEIQIANPGFDSLVNLVTDSTVTTTLLNYTLVSGNYEWRVRAINSSSSTTFSEAWKFTIQ